MTHRITNVAIALLLLVACIVWLGNSRSDTGTPAESATNNQSGQNTPSTSSTSKDGSPSDKPLDAFTLLVLEYEEAYHSPDSLEKETRLAKIATKRYLKDHKSLAGSNQPVSDLRVTISRNPQETSVLMEPSESSANVRFVAVNPVITTTTTDDKGHKTIVHESFHLPLHSTTWILEDGLWKVDQEKR